MAEPIEWATAFTVAKGVIEAINAGKSIYDIYTASDPVDLVGYIDKVKKEIIHAVVEEVKREFVSSNLEILLQASAYWNQELLPSIKNFGIKPDTVDQLEKVLSEKPGVQQRKVMGVIHFFDNTADAVYSTYGILVTAHALSLVLATADEALYVAHNPGSSSGRPKVVDAISSAIGSIGNWPMRYRELRLHQMGIGPELKRQGRGPLFGARPQRPTGQWILYDHCTDELPPDTVPNLTGKRTDDRDTLRPFVAHTYFDHYWQSCALNAAIRKRVSSIGWLMVAANAKDQTIMPIASTDVFLPAAPAGSAT